MASFAVTPAVTRSQTLLDQFRSQLNRNTPDINSTVSQRNFPVNRLTSDDLRKLIKLGRKEAINRLKQRFGFPSEIYGKQLMDELRYIYEDYEDPNYDQMSFILSEPEFPMQEITVDDQMYLIQVGARDAVRILEENGEVLKEAYEKAFGYLEFDIEESKPAIRTILSMPSFPVELIDSKVISELIQLELGPLISDLSARFEIDQMAVIFVNLFELGEWHVMEELVFYIDRRDGQIPGFPLLRLENPDIMKQLIKDDRIILLRNIINELPAPTQKELFVENGLFHLAADAPKIFKMFIEKLTKETVEVGLTTPDSDLDDPINYENQFKGNLPMEKLFHYNSNGVMYDSAKFSILSPIVRLLPPLMFNALEQDELADDEKTVLQAILNTVGRWITRLRDTSISLQDDEQEKVLGMYLPFVRYFNRKVEKIVELFKMDYSMKWLFETTWNMKWIEIESIGEWVPDRSNDNSEDGDHDIEYMRDRENQLYWRSRNYYFSVDPMGWRNQSDSDSEDSDSGSEDSDSGSEDPPDINDPDEDYWEELGYEWDDEDNEWVNEGNYEVDRFSNESSSNAGHWLRRDHEWSDPFGQWVSKDEFDFVLFYLPSTYYNGRVHRVGIDDIVGHSEFGECRIHSIDRTGIILRRKDDQFTIDSLNGLKFIRISVRYLSIDKEIEVFDIVEINGKHLFVSSIEREKYVRVKLRDMDGSWPDMEWPTPMDIKYMGNGRNCMWTSKSVNTNIRDFREDYTCMTADKGGIVAIISKPDKGQIEYFDEFNGTNQRTIQIIDGDCQCIAMYDSIIAVGSGEVLWTMTREGASRRSKGLGSRILSLVVSDKWLVVGLANGKIIKTEVGESINDPINAHVGPVKHLDIDGDRIISASGTTLKIWDSNAMNPLFTVDDHAEEILDISINGDCIVTGGDDGIVKQYDRKGNFQRNVAFKFGNKLVATDRFIVYDSTHNEGDDERPVYAIDKLSGDDIAKKFAWAPMASMAVVGNNIVMVWPSYSELEVFSIGGELATVKYEDGKMLIHKNGSESHFNGGTDVMRNFLERYKFPDHNHNSGERKPWRVGTEWSGRHTNEYVIIVDFKDGEVVLTTTEKPYGETFSIPLEDMEKRYNKYGTFLPIRANIPVKDEIWVHRNTGIDVKIISVGHEVLFVLQNETKIEKIDIFCYLFQIKPAEGSQWIEIATRQRFILGTNFPVPREGLGDFFVMYKVAPELQPTEDKNNNTIELGYMVDLIGYRLPWKVIEILEDRIRVKKLKPPKDPPEPDEILLVDASDTRIYHKTMGPDDIRIGMEYDVALFRYDELPNEDNSLCMDIGTPKDCDVGEFTSTKYQPVKIKVKRGIDEVWEIDGDGILTVFCAKELKDWLRTPEVATELDTGGQERENYNANEMVVFEYDYLKESSPFTNNRIVSVQYLTQDEIDEQVLLVDEEDDNEAEIAALNVRIERLIAQVDTASDRLKPFYQQQLAAARRSLTALQTPGAQLNF